MAVSVTVASAVAMAGPVVNAVAGPVVNAVLENISHTHGQQRPGSTVDLTLEEHLRQQPIHLHSIRVQDAIDVAFVKQTGIGKQWYAITYASSSLSVKAVTTLSMGWKKRLGEARDMKKSWVHLQTGQAPLLATEKTGRSGHRWYKLALADQACSNSSSGSWCQLLRLLGIFNHHNHNSAAAGCIDCPHGAVPVVVLFALLAAAAGIGESLSLKLHQFAGADVSGMKLEKVMPNTIVQFSRALDAHAIFIVRSSWRFAAMIDAGDH